MDNDLLSLGVSGEGFSVLVEGEDLLFGESSLFDDCMCLSEPSEAPLPLAEGSMTASSEDEPSKKRNGSASKKRERGRMEQEAGQVCLSKEDELEVTSLSDFEHYVARVCQQNAVTDQQKTELNNQRKRIRNRLYAQQKRQKEKELKAVESDLVQQLRAEVSRLMRENAILRDENKRLGGTGTFSAGRVSVFAFVVTFSVLFSPLSSIWTGRGAYSTGRTLMGVHQPPRDAKADSWSSLLWGTSTGAGGVRVASGLERGEREFAACGLVLDNSTAAVFKCQKYI